MRPYITKKRKANLIKDKTVLVRCTAGQRRIISKFAEFVPVSPLLIDGLFTQLGNLICIIENNSPPKNAIIDKDGFVYIDGVLRRAIMCDNSTFVYESLKDFTNDDIRKIFHLFDIAQEGQDMAALCKEIGMKYRLEKRTIVGADDCERDDIALRVCSSCSEAFYTIPSIYSSSSSEEQRLMLKRYIFLIQ